MHLDQPLQEWSNSFIENMIFFCIVFANLYSSSILYTKSIPLSIHYYQYFSFICRRHFKTAMLFSYFISFWSWWFSVPNTHNFPFIFFNYLFNYWFLCMHLCNSWWSFEFLSFCFVFYVVANKSAYFWWSSLFSRQIIRNLSSSLSFLY